MEIVNTFYLCALQGNISLLKELQKYHSIDINISDKDGTTALILASANNQFEMVSELLLMGADANKVRKSGTGPLFFACQSGYYKVAEVLLKFGANCDKRNNRDLGNPLLVAAQNGHTSCVNLLLNNGANINHQLMDGATALFLASQSGHMLTLETLIRYGADVNLHKKDLTTPLYIASQMGHHKVVKRLLESGANVDAAREDGSTSLFKAAQKGHRLVIEVLLKKGASTGLLANGETALHMAVLFGRTRITHLLLVNGADPLLKNKDGVSSSELAKEAQFNDLVIVLDSYVSSSPTSQSSGSSSSQNHRHHKRRHLEPYSAPCSLTSVEMLASLCSTPPNEDCSSSQCSNNTTTTTNTTIGALPHLSAPDALPQFILPRNKLYNGFLPPRNEKELIEAIEAMARPSVVQNDQIKSNLEIHNSSPKSELEQINLKLDLSSNTELELSNLTQSELEQLPMKLDKLLQSRHSNPEIREIEEFRKSFITNNHVCTNPCSIATASTSTTTASPVTNSNPPNSTCHHPVPSSIKNSHTNCVRFTNSKPVYLRTATAAYRTQSANNTCNWSYYIPPHNPPPPLPIPPQISINSTNSNINNSNSNNCSITNICCSQLTPASSSSSLLDFNTTAVLVGRRKMSQPNMKTFQYDK